MKTIAAILLTLAACADPDPTGTVDDPRAVSCDTFRMDGYRQKLPQSVCYFDVSDLDWNNSPFPLLPGEPLRPDVIGWWCGENCSGGNGVAPVDATTFKVGTIMWSGDTEYGVAVRVGDWDNDRCIFTRCTRVESQ